MIPVHRGSRRRTHEVHVRPHKLEDKCFCIFFKEEVVYCGGKMTTYEMYIKIVYRWGVMFQLYARMHFRHHSRALEKIIGLISDV